MYMSHSNDGVIDLTNPMLSHNFVLHVKIFVMWNKWFACYWIIFIVYLLYNVFFYSQYQGVKLIDTKVKPQTLFD